jgi:hypothetical protein
LAVSRHVNGEDNEFIGKTIYRLMGAGEGEHIASTGIFTLNYTTSTISFDGRSKSEKLDDVKAARRGPAMILLYIDDHEALRLYPILLGFT